MTRALTIALISSTMMFAAPHAMAAGESDSSSDTTTCKAGLVFDKKKQKCVKSDDANLNDAEWLENGRALAYAERYDEAIFALNQIDVKDTAQVLNYLGYATRKSGKLEEGLAYYRRALDLDPDYTLARAYMGEALIKKGDRSGAEEQLAEIKSRCGDECREYKLLAAALEPETGWFGRKVRLQSWY